MSKRNYKIQKLHPSNTHYSVRVTDSYGQEHGSFFKTTEECDNYAYEIWENEVNDYNKNMELLANAIWGCTKLDEELGLIKGNRDNLD